jgi:ABC-type phosphate/phosphonate transport system permease subunit
MIEVNSAVQIVSILTSVSLVALVVWLIRRGRFREETALYWLLTTGVLLLFALRRDLLGWTAAKLGIYYPPMVLLLGIIFAGTLLAIHFSISLAHLNDQNKRLAQELALLAQRVDYAAQDGAAITLGDRPPQVLIGQIDRDHPVK